MFNFYQIIDEVSAILDEISREMYYMIKNKKYSNAPDNNSCKEYLK
jgi:hypothetical protein